MILIKHNVNNSQLSQHVVFALRGRHDICFRSHTKSLRSTNYLGSCPTYLGRGVLARARWLPKTLSRQVEKSVRTGRFQYEPEKPEKHWHAPPLCLRFCAPEASSANAGRYCRRQCLLLYKLRNYLSVTNYSHPVYLEHSLKMRALCEVLVVMPKKIICLCLKKCVISGCRSVHASMN